jgi:predicted CopG family antitoxin
MTKPVSFSEALAEQIPRRRGNLCETAKWRSEQTAEDVIAFDKALKSTRTSTDINRAMKKMGFTGRVDNLQRHRRGDCACDIS